MLRVTTFACLLIICALLPLSSNAQQVYIGTEIGFGFGKSLDFNSSDNDFPTTCDKYLDPSDHFEPVGGCTSDSDWSSSHDGSIGILAGMSLGLSTDLGIRVEAEYFYFGSDYDSVDSLLNNTDGGVGGDVVDKANQELVRAEDHIGQVSINSLFLNLYYDLPTSGNLRPYAGGGVGFGMAEAKYGSYWGRNVNPDAIKTADEAKYKGSGDQDADREAFHERVAGTTTTESHTLEDTVFGFQAIIGVDYLLTEKTSLGIKGRWVKYGDFSDGDTWDQLRSHASNNGVGTPTVEYTTKTEDLSAFGVSLVMKYAF